MKLFVVLLGVIMIGLPASAEEPVVIGERLVIRSDILDEDRPYLVSLPESYNDRTYSPRRYPVLYVLDGETQFLTAVGIVNHMGNPKNNRNMRIPEMIVVAIPNTTDRMRDLTPTKSLRDFNGNDAPEYSTSGGGARFLQFIKNELIPTVEKNYRTRPFRTFAGHSLGGMTVLHSLLTQPGLFQNYIAMDSSLWWDGEVMNKRLRDFVPGSPVNNDARGRVFISTADHSSLPDGRSPFMFMTASNMYFAEWLQKHLSSDFDTEFRIFKEQDHASVPLLSLYFGLMHAFKEYKIPSDIIMDGDAEALSRHFRSFSTKAGIRFLPPEDLVDMLATIGPGAYDYSDRQVLEFLELNAKNYPDSGHAGKRLSDFLMKKAQKDTAAN
jgi:predicted alpha/beta superfamily hydrolase